MVSDFRQFRLINATGEEYDLTAADHFFAYPDGLGFERSYSSLQIGDAFVAVESPLRQQKVTGEMIFLDYSAYDGFRRFIAEGRLTLAYQPAGFTTWYYRSCKVESLKKGEISTSTGRLHCNVDFLCFSLWYESVTAEKTMTEVGENALFPLTFPFLFSDCSINEVVIYNTNTAAAPCKIDITGPCSNPRWEMVCNGIVVKTGKVSMSLGEGEHLIVDSNVESMRIVKSVGGVESDAYQYSDFTTDRFLYAPSGKSLVRFYHDSATALAISVEVRKVSDTV